MSEIRVENLVKTFGAATAVDNLSIQIGKGEMAALLGPSGCGKTTLLRMIAGFETPTSGIIRVNGEAINDVPPQQRKIGIVFQDYAIFPTMTVFDNIAYGLRIKKQSKEEIQQRVMEYLGLVGLVGYEKRMPSQLSGGQQQRVALARALITKPEVFLLDEPLSNLDAALRLRIRKEIRKIQQALGITAVFVTHDQEEALSIADKIFVMRQGKLMQAGTPEEIYTKPANDFVADFIGKSNILYGKIVQHEGEHLIVQTKGGNFKVLPPANRRQEFAKKLLNTDVWLSIRPHFITVQGLEEEKGKPLPASQEEVANQGRATLTYVEYLGNYTKGEIRLPSGIDVEFERYHLDSEEGERVLKRGQAVSYAVKPSNIFAGLEVRGIE
jgi:ABC-type Fe3+/spermidine/putrescine transport system ATPase subunit